MYSRRMTWIARLFFNCFWWVAFLWKHYQIWYYEAALSHIDPLSDDVLFIMRRLRELNDELKALNDRAN